MKWFKHYSDASMDSKICELEQEFGYIGYGVYWKILEICALQWDGISEPKFTLNRMKTKSILRVNYKKIESILKVSSVLNLFSAEINEKNYIIEIPNLLKIKDNHSKNLQATGKKVSKNLPLDKIRKEKNKNIYISKNYSVDDVINLWNKKLGEKLGYCQGLGSGKHLINLSESMKFVQTLKEWEDIFSKCETTPNLMGENNIGWKVNLLWLVDYDNFLKVQNGNYDNGSASKLDSWVNQ